MIIRSSFLASLTLHIYFVGVSNSISNNRFPKDFIWGVSTAAPQIEGAWNIDGKGETIWDHFTHVRNFTNADVACDSYHKYKEDVQLIKNLGVQIYRLSISWSRILPTGLINQVNQEGIEYYKKLIKELRKNGLELMVTLYHWDLPQKLMYVGGWPNEILADYFAEYARLCFEHFGKDVRYWITFNEPSNTCQSGWGDGHFAPGITFSGVADYLCTHTILKAHAKAYHIYDKEFRKEQGGLVSIVVNTFWFEPASDDPKDMEASTRTIDFNLGLYAHPVYSKEGNYPKIMIDRIAARSKLEGFTKSRLPQFTQEEIEYIRGTFDVFSLNYYTTNMVKWIQDETIGEPSWNNDVSVRIYNNPSFKNSSCEWLQSVPWGLRKLLNWVDKNFDHPPIIITENGYCDEGGLNDPGRTEYIATHLDNALAAISEDGVNLIGYFHWSLMDNFEWTDGYTKKFGLHKVDFDSPNKTRTIKESGHYFKRIVTSGCLLDECV